MQKQSLIPLLAIALALSASACGGRVPEPTATLELTPTPEPTNTPKPTPTATPIPLSQIDLEPLLIQSGDLPVGLSGAQIRSSLPEMFDDLPDPDGRIYAQFERDERAAGGVAVMLYESCTNVDAAYAALVDSFGEPVSEEGLKSTRETIADIGEKAEAVTIESELAGVYLSAMDLVFARCHAVVHIRMTGTSSLVDIKSYAERLDRRLAGVVCP